MVRSRGPFRDPSELPSGCLLHRVGHDADEAGALTYLNYVTSRRGATAISSTGAQLFEDVITERRKELAFEGDRFLDLQRLKRDITRSSNYPAAALSLPYANFRRLMPIPQVEIDANPAIKPQQNTGY